MSRSGGEKSEAERQAKRSAAGGKSKAKAAPKSSDIATLERETERLREELASERRRAEKLEDANHRVAARLDEAIESVKAILARQG